MPTKRFLNLKEEKKRMILDAAVHEFSRVPYMEASINQIIKEADISRGSFYTYFEDKNDLMRYLLKGFREQCQERILSMIREENGNYFAVPIRILMEAMELGEDGIGYKLFQNLLSDLSAVDQSQLFGIKGFLHQDPGYREFIDSVYEAMDRDQYPIEKDVLSYGVEMAMMIVIKGITLFYKHTAEKEKILTVTRNEMRILEQGVCALKGAGQMEALD